MILTNAIHKKNSPDYVYFVEVIHTNLKAGNETQLERIQAFNELINAWAQTFQANDGENTQVKVLKTFDELLDPDNPNITTMKCICKILPDSYN